MMQVLLDTHVLIWAMVSPERLSSRALTLLSDRSTELFVSSASIWELGIKYHSGKVPELAKLFLRINYHLAQLGAREMPIRHEHALMASSLPLIHKDPFDRMLVAQALVEGFPLVTHDEMLQRYSVLTIWQ